jgi:hypothetical protein
MGLISCAQAQWIDFSRSFITWLTKAEQSYGRFSIESACTVLDPGHPEPQAFYLAAAVVAGRVYAQDRLFITPSYTFHLITSLKSHQIFRNYASYQEAKDSQGKNEEIFADLQITRRECSARVIGDVQEIIDLVINGHPLSAQMRFISPVENREFVLQFPVRHINVQRGTNRFQVETGPVLVPRSSLLGDEKMDGESPHFNMAYVIFNRLDQAELALWRPTPLGAPVRGNATRFYTDVREIKTETILLTLAGLASG